MVKNRDFGMSSVAAAALGLALVALGIGAADAQTAPAPGNLRTMPEKTTGDAPKAPSTIQDGRSDSLSTKLNHTNGVIAPKGDIDPGMAAPAPVAHPNSTPVIPPSATGGESAK